MKNYQKLYVLLSQNKAVLVQLAIVMTILCLQSCAIEDDTPYTDPREKFLGTWSVNDQPGRINYQVNIVNDPAQSTQVILYNFADMGASASGLVVGSKIIVDKQDVGNEFLASGTGTYISSNKLEFEFMLDNGIDVEQRVAVFSK
jgi:hypothetical protein